MSVPTEGAAKHKELSTWVETITAKCRLSPKNPRLRYGIWMMWVVLAPLHAQNGRTPANSSAPVDASGAPLQPSIFRPHWREELERKGLTITLEEIYDFQGNPTGGRTQMGTASGRVTGSMNLDLQKLLSWQGANVTVTGLFQTGSNLAATYIGSWDATSSTAGTHSLRLNEYFLDQKLLSGKLTLRVGQISAKNEFDNQAIGFNDEAAAFKTWINDTLCCNPPITNQTYASFSAAAKPGLYVRGDPSKHFLYKLAVFSAPHKPYVGDPSGLRFDLRDAPAMGSTLGYRHGDESSAHAGIYKIGQIHNFGHYFSLITHKQTHGNDEYFVDIGQALWRRKVNGHYTNQEVDSQFSISATPRRLNINDVETIAGIRLVGLTYRRPVDIVAIGVVNAHFSRDYSKELAQTGQPGRASQTTLEVGYKFVLRPWLSVWPDFQYIWKPSGDKRLGDAPVLALRLVVDH